jgi:carboxy-cis,cis-muconate cyclase
VIQSWKYSNESGIHGLDLGRHNSRLYTADLSADSIWTHEVNEDGTVDVVHRYKLLKSGMHPRHLQAHPKGQYLYVLMEAANSLEEYALNEETGAPRMGVVNYSLIPKGEFKGVGIQWSPLHICL